MKSGNRNMKICYLGDLHFGIRNDSEIFYEFQKYFFVNILFPYLKKNNIKHIVQLGDFFDRRQYINFKTLHFFYEYFPDLLVEYDVEMTVFLGNHDVALKSSNHINSPSLLLRNLKNLNVITHNTELVLSQGKEKFHLSVVPWINNTNYAECVEFINNTTNQYLAGHFEINGFEMHKGQACDDGMETAVFDKFSKVVTGHFHTRSDKGNILYTGTPYELSWNDWNDQKGFYIFDTKTHDFEFVENPHKLFYRVNYQNTIAGKEFIDVIPYTKEPLTNKYVKLMCDKKDDDYLFEKFLKNLHSQMPLDLQVTLVSLFSNMDIEADISTAGKTIRELIIENVEATNEKVYSAVVKKEATKLLLDIHSELNNVR